jgi:ketosteroid isomerase-like protein
MSKPTVNSPLPEAISSYFSAKNDQDTKAILECFTSDATIIDAGENNEMSGLLAIQEWLEGPVADYQLKTEVTESTEMDGQTIVIALVSGNFPGSPIEFSYHFRLKDGKIIRLEIR